MLPLCISGLFTGLSLVKMAEVSQKLGNGAYRLSALRTRPVSREGSRVSGVRKASSRCPVREHSAGGRSEDEPVSNKRSSGRRSRKLWTVRKSESRLETADLLCATSLETRFMRFSGSEETLQAVPAALQLRCVFAGRFQEKLLPRRTLWITPSDSFSSLQHERTFCTVVFVRTPERTGCGLHRLHPDVQKGPAAARSYSWWSEEAPLVPRSKTAYYDILKVSPTATQAQIKTAYYKQSFIHHPDKNPDDKDAAERFTAVSEAYTVLGNISLRKKYDRGILSQSDIQSAGRSSSKGHAQRSSGSSRQQQQQQQRARRFTQPDGKPIYDFDAFYQAHYGEQLQREKEMRARKQHIEMLKKRQGASITRDMIEVSMTMILTVGGLIFLSLLK